MQTLHLHLANLKINFSTNFDTYFEYLSVYFQHVIVSENKKQDCHLDITFDWTENLLSEQFHVDKNAGRYIKVGANTFLAQDALVTIRKIERKYKVGFEISIQDQKMNVYASFQKKPLKDFFRYGPLSGSHDEWFFSLTYYFLYYPVFWYLEQNRNTHMLHASAFRVFNQGVVVCGLEGIGKTSLGLKFLKEENSEFLSDNLICYDTQKVYPCYEMIRMHDADENLWIDQFEQVNKLDMLKGFFKPKFHPNTNGIKPHILIFPEFSHDFCVEQISSSQAANRALVLSHLPAELNNYSEYRQLYNLLDLSVTPWSSQHDVLQTLLKDVTCYRVGMRKEDGLDQNFQRLKNAIFKNV